MAGMSANKQYLIELLSTFDDTGAREAEKAIKKVNTAAAQGRTTGLTPIDTRAYETAGARLALIQEKLGTSGLKVAKIINEDVSQSFVQGQGPVQNYAIQWKDAQGVLHNSNIAFVQTARGLELINNSVSQSVVPMQKWGAAIGMAMKRALLVAPIWMLMRTAMMATIQTFKLMGQAIVDLDDQLARIRTVVSASGGDIEGEMAAISSAIISTAQNSRVPLKELAETYYYLRTSALSASEAMAAFKATNSLMVATGIAGKEAARGVAGLYNTLKDSMDRSLPIHQQMQKIADLLAYTYATQDVEMSELLSSYAKLAPFITITDNNMTQLVTTMGVLNTLLLRGGSAGRLTGQMFIDIAKKANKLKDIFNIAIDTSKPLDFIDILGQLRDRIGDTGKISAETSAKLGQIFQKRSLADALLLISHFDKLTEAEKRAAKEAVGYTQRMEELKMNTIAGQTERLANNIRLLGIEFVNAANGGKGYIQFLKDVNSLLMRLQDTAFFVGWALDNLGKVWNSIGSDFTEESNKNNQFRGLNDAIVERYKARIDLQNAETAAANETAKAKQKELQLQNNINEAQKRTIDLLKLTSANEYMVAQYKYAQEQSEENLSELIKSRYALLKQYQNDQLNFTANYLQASAEEKKTIQELVKLVKSTPEELANIASVEGPARDLLLKNRDLLKQVNKEGYDAFVEALNKLSGDLGIDIFKQAADNAKNFLPSEEDYQTLAKAYTQAMTDAHSTIIQDFIAKFEEAIMSGTSSANTIKEEAAARTINSPEEQRYFNEVMNKLNKSTEDLPVKVSEGIKDGLASLKVSTPVTNNITIEVTGKDPQAIVDEVEKRLQKFQRTGEVGESQV